MRDLARFFVLLGIVIRRLHAREAIEGAEGELGKATDAFHRHHEGVTTEERDIPGNTRRRDIDAALHRKVRHPERLHIGDRLSPDAGQRGVAGGGELDRREDACGHLRIALLDGAAGQHPGAFAVDYR